MAKKNELASTTAYRRLRNAIISLELQPGEPLRESDLMSRFDLQRLAIREATARLIREHLVVMRPGFGSHVAEVRLTDVGDIFEAREHMEKLAAHLAAKNATPRDLEALAELADRTGSQTHFEIDLSFHNQIAQMTRNRFVTNALETLYAHSIRMFRATKTHQRPRREVAESHQEITAALTNGCAPEAERTILEHTRRAKELLLDSL